MRSHFHLSSALIPCSITTTLCTRYPPRKKRGDADVVEGDDRARCPFDSLDFWFRSLEEFWVSLKRIDMGLGLSSAHPKQVRGDRFSQEFMIYVLRIHLIVQLVHFDSPVHV